MTGHPSTGGDEIACHALHHDDGPGELVRDTTDSCLETAPDMIAEAFTEIHDLEIRRSLAGHS